MTDDEHFSLTTDDARKIAQELWAMRPAEDIPGGDPAAPAYRSMTHDLLFGGRNQCAHGVPNGAALRAATGTPGCPFCRRTYQKRLEEGQ